MKSAPNTLSMKQIFTLMSALNDIYSNRSDKFKSTEDAVKTLSTVCGFGVTLQNLRTACKNADIKLSSLIDNHGSPLSTLHNRVTELLDRLDKAEQCIKFLEAQVTDLQRRCPAAPHTKN